MADGSRAHQHGAETQARQQLHRPEQRRGANLVADENVLAALQRMAAGGQAASPEAVLRLQRSIGNRAVGRVMRGAHPERAARSASVYRPREHGGAVQRALTAKLTVTPTFSDGLTVATMKSTGLDKPPRPKKEGADWTGKLNADARKTFKNIGITDQALFDANLTDARLLQPGELHGNQLYQNKSGDLPATTTYKEYDTALYLGDPRLRGGDRVVAGADGRNYFTSDHYKNFAEF